jgi:hypothetical protein
MMDAMSVPDRLLALEHRVAVLERRLEARERADLQATLERAGTVLGIAPPDEGCESKEEAE